jgi:hypothetical protein
MAPNDRLREALSSAGMTPVDLAEQLDVDPKTAERWVTQGRTPYPRFRHQIAAMVRENESYLWPTAVSRAERDRAAESEIVRVYPHRSSVPADLWTRLFDSATDQISVLVYAGLFLPEQQPKLITRTLCDRAEAGVRTRLLLGDPECAQVAARGAEEGIGEAMAAKIRNVLTFYRPHVEHGCIEVRLHKTTLYNSIYRFDDECLVNAHVYGLPAAHAPVLHLRRLSAGDLFTTYTETFDRIWEGASPAWSDIAA